MVWCVFILMTRIILEKLSFGSTGEHYIEAALDIQDN